MSGRMRCTDIRKSGPLSFQVSKYLVLRKRIFSTNISAHNYVTFKPNSYLCWSIPKVRLCEASKTKVSGQLNLKGFDLKVTHTCNTSMFSMSKTTHVLSISVCCPLRHRSTFWIFTFKGKIMLVVLCSSDSFSISHGRASVVVAWWIRWKLSWLGNLDGNYVSSLSVVYTWSQNVW